MWGFPMLPSGEATDPWEEEQKKREREMAEALRNTQKQELPRNPGSIDEPEPGNEYLDEYAEHVRSMPRIQDYEPSTLRKILSVIGGTLAGGNPEVTSRLAAPGYYRDMGQWTEKGKGLKEVAGLGSEERRTDVTELGQRRSMEEGRRGREFQAGESERDRQARLGEAEAEQRFRTGEREAGETFEEEQNKLDRESREKYYEALTRDRNADRFAQLTPTDMINREKLIIQQVLLEHPEWHSMMNEETGLPDYRNYDAPGFWDTEEEKLAAWLEFLEAIEQKRAALYPGDYKQTRAGDVPPAGGQD